MLLIVSLESRVVWPMFTDINFTVWMTIAPTWAGGHHISWQQPLLLFMWYLYRILCPWFLRIWPFWKDRELINKGQGTHFAMWANVHLEVGKTHTHTHAHTHTYTYTLPSANRKKHILLYFPGDIVVKSLFVNAGDAEDAVSIPGLGRSPGVGNDTPTPVFLTGKFHGQRILEGYSLWGCKESDLTELLSAHTHIANSILPSFKQCLDWRTAKLVSRYPKPVVSLTHWSGILIHVGSAVDAWWKRQALIFCIPGHSRGRPVDGIDASASAVWFICTLDISQPKSSIISESENWKYLCLEYGKYRTILKSFLYRDSDQHRTLQEIMLILMMLVMIMVMIKLNNAK